jgi:hypothetical protein
MSGQVHKERSCWCHHDGDAHFRKSTAETELGPMIGCQVCDRRPTFDLPELRTVAEDRRRYERVNLDQPIQTSMGSASAHVIDASISGLGVLHHKQSLPVGTRCRLNFQSDFGTITLECEVRRTGPDPQSSTAANESWQTGLQIVDADPESAASLRKLLMAITRRQLPKNTSEH